MKWNVILKDYETGKFKPYNIFEHEAFRLAIEKLCERQYPKDRFLKELDQEARYYFWEQIEWEIFIKKGPIHRKSYHFIPLTLIACATNFKTSQHRNIYFH